MSGFNSLAINSHKGGYQVHFNQQDLSMTLSELDLNSSHFIIDANVARLYAIELKDILQSHSVLLIEAIEPHKSLECFPQYIEHLVQKKLRRNHQLVAIGGGIIQDITCFLAATMLRGVNWWFYPTTLLAQADSCIGSKSSINCGNIKNILGTFTPPQVIFVNTCFLNTLAPVDVRSGVGEMLKVHAIKSPSAFDEIAAEYDVILSDSERMLHYIRRSLEIKKEIIEQDEFDCGLRNVMNYGHTFGHAIEAATQYAIPHGIAVTIGMDMANFVAADMKLSTVEHFHRMHPTLKQNYIGFERHFISIDEFISAISKDKKNMGSNQIGLILSDQQGKPTKYYTENDANFKKICEQYFSQGRTI